MSGTTPMKRQMPCPTCGRKAQATLRFGDQRRVPPRPPILEMENHFPPSDRDLCGDSETALPSSVWPAWAKQAVAAHVARLAERGRR